MATQIVLLNKKHHGHILNDKIMRRDENDDFIVYEWQCDLVNNLITGTKNVDDTKNINSLILKMNSRYDDWYRDYFFEHDGISYVMYFKSNEIICLKIVKNNYLIKSNNKFHNDDKWRGKEDELYISNSQRNESVIINALNLYNKKRINECVKICGKINDNIYYGKKSKTILQTYRFFQENVEIKNIDLRYYGNEIKYVDNLKEKIYIMIKNNTESYILTYDTKTNNIEIDYSFGTQCSHMVKYKNILLILCGKKKFQGKILSLKPYMGIINACDIFLIFISLFIKIENYYDWLTCILNINGKTLCIAKIMCDEFMQ